MIPMIDSCIDKPDSRDFLFDTIFGVDKSLPTKIDNVRTAVYNQWEIHDPSTTYACTVYSMVHCQNEGNAIEAEKSKVTVFGQIDPVATWKLAIGRWAKQDEGWTLQWACKMAKDFGYISGYTKCPDIDSIKKALSQNQLIQTGSNKIDWAWTIINCYSVVPGKSYGHAFMIEGYDDDKEWLICRNSYGSEYGIKGRFYVTYDNYDLLYSCYAYTDKDNSDTIKLAQSMARRMEAFARWIWNKERPDNVCTKFEAATMAMRATWQYGTRGIWNQQDGWVQCKRYEAVMMLQLWSGRKFTFQIGNLNQNITRWEMAELSVRI